MSQNTKKAIKSSHQKFSALYSLGVSASKNIWINQDSQLLAQRIVQYMQEKNPNFEFIDFYDPVLVKAMRILIKDQDEFKKFLQQISFSIEDFLEISVYVIPTVYTTHLIRYIREAYLGKITYDKNNKPTTLAEEKRKRMQKIKQTKLEKENKENKENKE